MWFASLWRALALRAHDWKERIEAGLRPGNDASSLQFDLALALLLVPWQSQQQATSPAIETPGEGRCEARHDPYGRASGFVTAVNDIVLPGHQSSSHKDPNMVAAKRRYA